MTNNNILNKVVSLKEEIEKYVHGKGITVPSVVFESIKGDKGIPKLLGAITHSVSASVGLDVHETLSDHLEGGYTLWGNHKSWTSDSKNQVVTLLLEKISEAKATVKTNEYFFFEDEKPTKEEREEALNYHKLIAECAIRYTFSDNDMFKPELQAKAFRAILQLVDIPGAIPSNHPVHVRNLISTSRFKDITKKESNPAPSIEALKDVARIWYQKSDQEHLYHKDGYHRYDYVDYYLYILTPVQLEQVRAGFLEEVEKSYDELKAETWDSYAISSAEFLIEKVRRIMSWKIER